MGLPALQDMGNFNTRLGLLAKHRKPPNKSKRKFSGTRGNSFAAAHVATKPQNPFLTPQQSVTGTGERPSCLWLLQELLFQSLTYIHASNQ